jgi:hypothetical protein
METTYNNIPSRFHSLLFNIKNNIQTPLYFYGSIQRIDFLQDYSDIDIDIFTENEQSTMIKLIHLLNLDKRDFKPVVYKIKSKKNTISGIKIKYKDETNNLKMEISIYNIKYKSFILEEHNFASKIPFINCFLLLILKILYYRFGVIPKFLYSDLKNKIIHFWDKNKPVFVDVGFQKP